MTARQALERDRLLSCRTSAACHGSRQPRKHQPRCSSRSCPRFAPERDVHFTVLVLERIKLGSLRNVCACSVGDVLVSHHAAVTRFQMRCDVTIGQATIAAQHGPLGCCIHARTVAGSADHCWRACPFGAWRNITFVMVELHHRHAQ